ncbi:hypothetical protein [Chroococcus sp. FPU101]|uniref:hypothetical protein n=1 Tax=Chroococcus sp. FPU101 TaxID=1974212 RepID=UPI001A90471C|nr:hypothetical protein [Chroococcus sp. FPU101]GFE70282.1 hypothetical protein CFPU101_28920 [Chroococcus sp. FPU101]
MINRPVSFKHLKATIVEAIDNHQRLRYLYQGFKQFINPPQKSQAVRNEFSFLIPPSASSFSGMRLNLIIPTINQELAFGGINTALRFWELLSVFSDNLRIIVMGDYSSSTYLAILNINLFL